MPRTPVPLARGGLEERVRDRTDAIVMGTLVEAEGRPWTAHRLAAAVKDRYPGGGAEPSTGAIADTLKRWRDIGFAVVGEKPLCFIEYTEEASTLGLTALKERAHQAKLEARAAAKAAEAPATSEAPEIVKHTSEVPGYTNRAEAPEQPVEGGSVPEGAGGDSGSTPVPSGAPAPEW